MPFRVMANIEDEPTSVHVEDCDDLQEAKELVRTITEEGFFYDHGDENMTFYSPWMIDTVTISKVNNVRD